MANHGAITYAGTVDAAVEASLLLEWACDVYARAVQAGEPRALSDEQQQAVVQAAVERSYGTTKKLEDES